MSKLKTVGERISYGLDRFCEPKWVAKVIDRAIRRAQAKAWDECAVSLHATGAIMPVAARSAQYANPYRVRAKR